MRLTKMLSRTALHAVKAMIALAERPDENQGAAAIAERVGAPPNYLGKLLQGMVAHGLVTSQKGMGGGFRLAKRPEEITLYDVVESIDHVSRWEGCFMGNEVCSPDQPCAMHERWEKVRSGYLELLRESHIADLVGK